MSKKKSKIKINLLSIAYRNLGRHKVKTAITLTAIAIGVGLYIWMDAWLLGCNLDSKRNLVNYETGSVKIYSKEYFDKKDEMPMYESFSNYEPIIEKLDENGYNAAPHFVFTGSLLSEEEELPFIFVGIDPEKEVKVLKYNNFLEENSKFIDNNSFSVLLGVRGAKDLKVKIGDSVRCSVTIDMKDEIGKIRHIHQVIDLNVTGIVNSPNPKTNGYIAYLPLGILQDDKGLMLDGRITEICIRKKGTGLSELPGKDESKETIKKILNGIIPDNLILVDYLEDAKDYLAMSGQDIVSTYIMIGVLFILAIVGIANTMLMAIFERIKEIGMLRSMGMQDIDVMKLFILEASLIGLIGSIIGIIIGLPLDAWIIYNGIDYTKIFEDANMHDYGYRIVGVFRGAWNFHTIIASPIVATLAAGLTSIIPALKAIKMSIVDTLRFE
jgi:ABC-type lipoprotein release transport system permease subunit